MCTGYTHAVKIPSEPAFLLVENYKPDHFRRSFQIAENFCYRFRTVFIDRFATRREIEEECTEYLGTDRR